MIPEHLEARMDPVFVQWLKATHVELPEGFKPTLEQMRGAFAQMAASVDNPIDPSIRVSDHSIDGRDGHTIPVRRYAHQRNNTPAPVCVFMHGGGWVLGNLDTHNGLCGDIALQSGLDVIAIDYRLSPENVFPAALHDCVDVVQYINANSSSLNIDSQNIAILGDSAGANLATATCLQLRDSTVSVKAQLLVYPALAANMDADSYTENEAVPGLSAEDLEFFFRAYNNAQDTPLDPLCAPLMVEDVSGLPDTFISAAEFDPLRDDGVLYADKLKQAGVDVTLRLEQGVGHSYLWLRKTSPVAIDAFAAQMAFLRGKFS
jgi:acetyl esterase